MELWWPFPAAVPADAEVEAFVRAVGDAGVRLVGLNFFAGDLPGGDRAGWCPGPLDRVPRQHRGDHRHRGRLGCRAFNALYGNRVDDADPAAQDDLAVENLAVAGQAATRIGGTVLVEPVSGPPLSAADRRWRRRRDRPGR